MLLSLLRVPLRYVVMFLVTFVIIHSICASDASQKPVKKVLVIGLDGTRTDAFKAADTPRINALIEDGAYSDHTSILSQRFTESDTISGPGWSSVLTGVWADKHGIVGMEAQIQMEKHDAYEPAHFDRYPSFIRRVRDVCPTARLGAFVSWNVITRHMIRGAYETFAPPDPNQGEDERVTEVAVNFLSNDDPIVGFVHLVDIDSAGHHFGFHPSVSQYISAIERSDERVGRLVDAVRGRPTYQQEDWLIIVATDHGGEGKSHDNLRQAPEVTNVFMVISGRAAKQGKLSEQIFIVDIAPTVLTHLGIAIDPSWNLDGRPVGLQ